MKQTELLTKEQRIEMSWEVFDRLLKLFLDLLRNKPYAVKASTMNVIVNFLRINGITLANLKKKGAGWTDALEEMEAELAEMDFSDIDEDGEFQ